MSNIVKNLVATENNLSFKIVTKPRPQPRHIHTRNSSKGRYPDDFYQYYNFLRSVFASISEHPKYSVFQVKYPLVVTIVLFYQAERKSCISDIDNTAKPILDALEASGIIQNDNMQFISELHLKSLFSQSYNSFDLSLFHNPHA